LDLEPGIIRKKGDSMTTQPRLLSLPQLAAVVAGNALEFYDFLIFGFFAIPIGATFFPVKDSTGSLLLTLATFGVGFLTRPLGGMVIGPLGDRMGRKPAMLFSFGLMGFSIAGLALTPSYASIGLAAPILVVLFRLLQGFALGGEVGPSTAFLIEAAPPQKRGLYVSFQLATQQVAILVSGLVGSLLSSMLTPADLNSWGWRVAMLLGVAVVPFALIIRRRLPETFQRPAHAKSALTRAQINMGLMTTVMAAAMTIATYTMNYLNVFASHTLGLPPAPAFAAVALAGLCGAIFNPLSGWLSDRLGRKPVMTVAFALLCAVSLPCFMMMAHLRTAASLYIAALVMAPLLALGSSATMAFLAESLPPQIRSGGIGIIYAVAITVFGGSASFVVAWLTAATGSPLAPAWYMCGALAIGLCAMVAVRETAPVKTG
jgi:MFS family permease